MTIAYRCHGQLRVKFSPDDVEIHDVELHDIKLEEPSPTEEYRDRPYPVAEPVPTEKRRKPELPTKSSTASADALISAFKEQQMDCFDAMEFEPTAKAVPTRRKPLAKIELDLEPEKDACLLLEQDGMYWWQYASRVADMSGQRLVGTAKRVEAPRTVTFYIQSMPSISPQRGMKRRGLIDESIFSKMRAIVFKFDACFIANQAMKFFERVPRGLVKISSANIEDWQLIGDLSDMSFPPDKPARILLLIHGTFSSTIGGFGSLTRTTKGRKFLEMALSKYDAVLGFNHATLSEDPLANATELLASLQTYKGKQPPEINVIAHSRGGLVFRSLVEELLPKSNWKPHIGPAIFVACTNGGTQLALPKNWKALADLYTNLAVATFRILGIIPQAKAVTLVLSEMIKGLGALVKYCATNILISKAIPGLTAMRPDGSFIKKINQFQPGQPTPTTSEYYAIVSAFKPRLVGKGSVPKEFPLRLLIWLWSGFAKQLMGKPNDLVVDVPSMTRIDPQKGNFIQGKLDFGGTNSYVYHTSYFFQPQVMGKLTQWLK